MSDLDIQIDVPDDDDLGSSVRVLNGDFIPPWLKAGAVLILGGLAALTIGAFFAGRTGGGDSDGGQVSEQAVPTTPLASAPASPAMDNALGAVEAWQSYTQSGDVAAIGRSFDPDGPQYAMLVDAVADPRPNEVDFAAQNLSESTADGITTVSMDLLVSNNDGQQVYPYDFVFLDDSTHVWTVIDRRSPGTVALPPSPEIVASARQSWKLFTSSMSIGDGAGASAVVGQESQEMAAQVGRAVGGERVDDPVLPIEVFELLVDRAAMTGASDPEDALVALLDPDQRQALAVGDLTSWTMVNNERIVASLEVAGERVAIVPFVASVEGWAFDLKGALESSGG